MFEISQGAKTELARKLSDTSEQKKFIRVFIKGFS